MRRQYLPRLPNPNDILNAKYTKENMRSYAHRAIYIQREALAEFFEENNQLFTGDHIARIIRSRSQK
jgi:hypothetical protein